jgi:hypothetical protein
MAAQGENDKSVIGLGIFFAFHEIPKSMKELKSIITQKELYGHDGSLLKGQCHEIFCYWFFFMNQFPPSPRVRTFFRKLAEIFASQGAPPVSTTLLANLPKVSATPAANFATSFATVVDIGGKLKAKMYL